MVKNEEEENTDLRIGDTIKMSENLKSLKDVQDLLQQKFEVDDVKQRDGMGGLKLDYIPIDVVLNRLNSVLPLGYSWAVDKTEIINGFVMLIGTLTITLPDGSKIQRSGVGADTLGKDLDKSIKTAYAEAIKKACNTLGIGLYLWDTEERASIAKERRLKEIEIEQANNSARKYSTAQLERMKQIKTTYNLKDDADLNKFLVDEYKRKGINTKADFNPVNIEEFFAWVSGLNKTK